jgi:hypothetical protein
MLEGLTTCRLQVKGLTLTCISSIVAILLNLWYSAKAGECEKTGKELTHVNVQVSEIKLQLGTGNLRVIIAAVEVLR